MTRSQLGAVDVCGCCVQGYDNSESSVRKAAVFCLVAVYLVVGEDLRPHLAPLSTSKVRDSPLGTYHTSDAHPRIFFFGGGGIFPPKLTIPQMAAKFCAWYFFRLEQTYHGNFLMDSIHRKLFISKQSKGVNLRLKCIKMRLASGSARTCWGSLCAA